MWNEYRFRKLIPLTHEEYLSEPADSVDWLLAMHKLAQELEAAAVARAIAKKGR